jgi:hypothetical protein
MRRGSMWAPVHLGVELQPVRLFTLRGPGDTAAFIQESKAKTKDVA